MFCPSCGTEYAIELKYCNRCGANLSTNLVPQVEPVIVNVTKPTLIIGSALALITLGGFGAVIGAIGELAPVLHGNDPIVAIIFMGMLTIMVVDIFLVRLLSKLISAALAPNPQPRFHPYVNSAPAQFPNPTTTARLQSVPSVTENTTRFFEPYGAPGETENQPTAEKIKR
ncbi:MAG TPA: zinc ribbon domain-containing protein [Pyrinomonadaceae bacterium]|nr:zinc ribbon domain-containing protein [Pyrinomonadaceae bacterium]